MMSSSFVTTPEAEYAERMKAGRLSYQWCRSHGGPLSYPRAICPECLEGELEWRDASGRGVIYATTEVHDRSGDSYNIVLVGLDEGVRIMSTVVADFAAIAIGKPVRVTVGKVPGSDLLGPVCHLDDGSAKA